MFYARILNEKIYNLINNLLNEMLTILSHFKSKVVLYNIVEVIILS